MATSDPDITTLARVPSRVEEAASISFGPGGSSKFSNVQSRQRTIFKEPSTLSVNNMCDSLCINFHEQNNQLAADYMPTLGTSTLNTKQSLALGSNPDGLKPAIRIKSN